MRERILVNHLKNKITEAGGGGTKNMLIKLHDYGTIPSILAKISAGVLNSNLSDAQTKSRNRV